MEPVVLSAMHSFLLRKAFVLFARALDPIPSSFSLFSGNDCSCLVGFCSLAQWIDSYCLWTECAPSNWIWLSDSQTTTFWFWVPGFSGTKLVKSGVRILLWKLVSTARLSIAKQNRSTLVRWKRCAQDGTGVLSTFLPVRSVERIKRVIALLYFTRGDGWYLCSKRKVNKRKG